MDKFLLVIFNLKLYISCPLNPSLGWWEVDWPAQPTGRYINPPGGKIFSTIYTKCVLNRKEVFFGSRIHLKGQFPRPCLTLLSEQMRDLWRGKKRGHNCILGFLVRRIDRLFSAVMLELGLGISAEPGELWLRVCPVSVIRHLTDRRWRGGCPQGYNRRTRCLS